jgi:hypothetical protein
MRTSHVLAALLLSGLAAASSPAVALPDNATPVAVHDAAATRAASNSDAADVERYSARQRKDAAKVQHFEGGDGVVVIATSTTVLVVAIVLLIILI